MKTYTAWAMLGRVALWAAVSPLIVLALALALVGLVARGGAYSFGLGYYGTERSAWRLLKGGRFGGHRPQ